MRLGSLGVRKLMATCLGKVELEGGGGRGNREGRERHWVLPPKGFKGEIVGGSQRRVSIEYLAVSQVSFQGCGLH